MWRHEASRRLYLILWLALPLTLLVPANQLSTCLGFYLLLKLMLVDYVFLKFPRLRAKYDTSSLIWQTLPTDADLDARHKVEQVRRPFPRQTKKTSASFHVQLEITTESRICVRCVKGLRNAAASGANAETRTFGESFNLPPSEQPLPGIVWMHIFLCANELVKSFVVCHWRQNFAVNIDSEKQSVTSLSHAGFVSALFRTHSSRRRHPNTTHKTPTTNRVAERIAKHVGQP